MSFFKQFPKVEYNFNQTGVKQNMVDIYRHVKPLPTFLDSFSAYNFYEIRNGERPDIVSTRLYGTSEFYWTFFVVNNFEHSLSGRFTLGETITGATSGATGTLTKKNIDMSQLIVQNATGAFIGELVGITNTSELITGSTSADTVSTYRVFKYADATYYYYNENDADKKPVTNAVHVDGGVADSDVAYVTNRTHEFELNEDRSKIRYIDPNYIGQFIDSFKKAINK